MLHFYYTLKLNKVQQIINMFKKKSSICYRSLNLSINSLLSNKFLF